MAKRTDGKKVTEETSEIVRANIKREAVRSEQFASIYANDTQIQLSPWDVRLIFGVIDSQPSNEKPTIGVTLLGEVRMSPQHAKRVATLLLRQLKMYEESVGPIPQPD